MGNYNKDRFATATFNRDSLRELDSLKRPGQSRNDMLDLLMHVIDSLKEPNETRADFIKRVVEKSITTFVTSQSVGVKTSASSVKNFIPTKSPPKSLVRPKVVREEN